MTEGMDLPGALTASPDVVGKAVVRAITRRSNTIYVLPVWRWVMLAIKLLPETLFKKTKI